MPFDESFSTNKVSEFFEPANSRNFVIKEVNMWIESFEIPKIVAGLRHEYMITFSPQFSKSYSHPIYSGCNDPQGCFT